MDARQNATQTPAKAQAKPAEPEFDLAAIEVAEEGDEDEPVVEDEAPQKVLKVKQFVDDLKQTYPEAKRFDIYLFSDRIQSFANPWTDDAPSIYFKPAVVLVSYGPKTKPALLSAAPFNEKYETTNWALTFYESKSRQIDPSDTVNVLKVLPELKSYNSNQYYQSRIEKPGKGPTEQSIVKQMMLKHDEWPTFKKARSQQSRPTERANDTSIDDLLLCL